MFNRRKLIIGLVSFVAAPAIVKASNLMPVKSYSDPKEVLDALIQHGYWIDRHGYKVGDILRVRLPSDFKVIDTPMLLSPAYNLHVVTHVTENGFHTYPLIK